MTEQNLVHPDDDGREILDLQGNPEPAEVRWRFFDHMTWKYKNDRAQEYPSIADQLDIIYHQGIDAWKATIQEIKDKYPKP